MKQNSINWLWGIYSSATAPASVDEKHLGQRVDSKAGTKSQASVHLKTCQVTSRTVSLLIWSYETVIEKKKKKKYHIAVLSTLME